ncbi:MAG: FAD-dependent oxidoreductase [Actinomycetota bacterium]|nr:FAD-dependent oxidoreductase [Actinomycetota bacterium]
MRYVIIGNGGAGLKAARTIRKRDAEGSITIVDEERYPCYYRMRMPDYICGWASLESLFVVDLDHYSQQRIRLILEDKVGRILPDRGVVVLESGSVLPYDRLLIASGARPRLRPCPGSDLDGVVYLRTLEQAEDIIDRAKKAGHAVALGGGLLGVELARCFNELGLTTHYLIREDRFWPQILDKNGSSLVESVLREKGIMLHTEEGLSEISGDGGRVTGVITATGDSLEADLVGIAIGVISNIDFLRDSGIETDRGIIVDDHLLTNRPHIYAAGDVAQAYDVVHGEHRVVTSWLNAQRQGATAGINMSGGSEALGGVVPFNVINIYGLSIASIGMDKPPGDETFEVLTGDYPRGMEYRKLILRDGVLVGANLIGDIKEARALETLIKSRADISAYRDRLFEPDFKAGDLLKELTGE